MSFQHPNCEVVNSATPFINSATFPVNTMCFQLSTGMFRIRKVWLLFVMRLGASDPLREVRFIGCNVW